MIPGNHIVLRTFKEADLDTYAEIVNDLSHIHPFWPVHLQSEANLRKEFAEGGFWKDDYKLLLITDEEGEFIGEVSSFKTSPNIQGPEIAYRIFRENNRRKGFATEAVKLFSAYLFRSEPNILRLTALILSDNAASKALIERCGYQKEGTLRKAEMHSGVAQSFEIYGLLREECPKLEDLMGESRSG